jgi:hypothetical protein
MPIVAPIKAAAVTCRRLNFRRLTPKLSRAEGVGLNDWLGALADNAELDLRAIRKLFNLLCNVAGG